MFFVGVALAFVFLHSFLFLFHRREPGNLHLAIAAFGFAVLIYGDTRGPESLGPEMASRLAVAGVAVMILGFIRFGHSFTQQAAPRIFLFFVMAAAVAVAWHAVTGGYVVPRLVIVLSLLELVRVLILGFRRPPGPRSWLVGLGFVAILVTAGIDTFADLRVIPVTWGGTYPYGMLLLFLSLSLYLSSRFADTHRDLERKLAEVQELSRQALEQERLARRREMERRLLESEHERQRKELEAARRLQLSLLPAGPPTHDGLAVEFEMRTATEVGGDYYDYRMAADGSLILAIGDATGHGLDAGLVVAATKGLFHAAEDGDGVAPMLESMSRGLAGLGLERMHMSLALLRYHRGGVALVSAAMPPVFLHRAREDRIEEVTVEAPPLASISGHVWAPLALELEPGDTLLAMTDGLAERLDPGDEMMGYDRLGESFARAASGDLTELRTHLFEAAREWGRGRARQDDETLLLLRRES